MSVIIFFSRAATILLAGLLGASALSHLRGSVELTSHYSAVGLPGISPLSIGLLQLVGTASLLVTRTRRLACLAIAIVMVLVLLEHVVRQRVWERGTIEALGLLALAGVSAWPARRSPPTQS